MLLQVNGDVCIVQDMITSNSRDTILSDTAEWIRQEGRRFGDLWIVIMFFPWRGFTHRIRPRDQSLGIVFAMLMVGLWAVISLLMGTFSHPVIGGISWLSALIWMSLLVIVVVPVAIHLLAAVATVILIILAPRRQGVSETVQVIAFATAPVPFLGIDLIGVQAVAALYGVGLMWYGMRVVHRMSLERALLVVALPAYILFAMGFDANVAIVELLRYWYII